MLRISTPRAMSANTARTLAHARRCASSISTGALRSDCTFVNSSAWRCWRSSTAPASTVPVSDAERARGEQRRPEEAHAPRDFAAGEPAASSRFPVEPEVVRGAVCRVDCGDSSANVRVSSKASNGQRRQVHRSAADCAGASAGSAVHGKPDASATAGAGSSGLDTGKPSQRRARTATQNGSRNLSARHATATAARRAERARAAAAAGTRDCDQTQPRLPQVIDECRDHQARLAGAIAAASARGPQGSWHSWST